MGDRPRNAGNCRVGEGSSGKKFPLLRRRTKFVKKSHELFCPASQVHIAIIQDDFAFPWHSQQQICGVRNAIYDKVPLSFFMSVCT